MPNTDPHTDVTMEQWRKMLLESPKFLPDGYQVAVHEATGEYVGLSMLFKRQADRDLDTGLTGVSRDWRRKGIALALKLRAIRFAKEYGAPCIRTGNEVNNRGMLGINERLGFVKQPAWIILVKRIAEEAGRPGGSPGLFIAPERVVKYAHAALAIYPASVHPQRLPGLCRL